MFPLKSFEQLKQSSQAILIYFCFDYLNLEFISKKRLKLSHDTNFVILGELMVNTFSFKFQKLRLKFNVGIFSSADLFPCL